MTDRPWVMRTYSGHTTAKASNELYRTNLAKGQTGLSIAFDLPTQNGYDPDDPMALGEVGKAGVPVPHLGAMRELFDNIAIEDMNTSMTINATAPWLLALYLALAGERGVDPVALNGTTQNDVMKEYLSRGTYIYGPEASKRLTVDLITYTVQHVPKWNPINVCSYHLQEVGAVPVQEVAFALATAVDVLDAVKATGRIADDEFTDVFARMSFFVNAGIRFIEETAKMRAFTRLWDRIGKERYGVTDDKARRFRYGVQVNSLGLTELQPENNVPRIVLESLGVTLSKDARARALQLPAWNEAMGLPRPWDQQWSLRIQQILAYETDLLEYGDIFEGSHVMERLTTEIADGAWSELERIIDLGGAFANIETLKDSLVASLTERERRIESGDQVVVGVNTFTETAPSPLTASLDDAILTVDPAQEAREREAIAAWRAARDQGQVDRALDALRAAAEDPAANIMEPTLELARAGGTVGEWAGALRDIFHEYRAPTGIGGVHAAPSDDIARVQQIVRAQPHRIRLLVGKPGLDGHSNGAEQIAVAARDAGLEVVYQGIRLTPAQIAAAARDEDVDIVGLSILSGSHRELVPEVLRHLQACGVDAPVVVGGIIPESDAAWLRSQGVAAVYTPKDYKLGEIMEGIVGIVVAARQESLGSSGGPGA